MTRRSDPVVGAAEEDIRDTAVDAAELGNGLAEHGSHVGDVEAN